MQKTSTIHQHRQASSPAFLAMEGFCTRESPPVWSTVPLLGFCICMEAPEKAIEPDRPAARSLGEDWRAGRRGAILSLAESNQTRTSAAIFSFTQAIRIELLKLPYLSHLMRIATLCLSTICGKSSFFGCVGPAPALQRCAASDW
jgi:hypothetical protein